MISRETLIGKTGLFLLLCYIVLVPFVNPLPGIGDYDEKRIFEIFLFSIISILPLLQSTSREFLRAQLYKLQLVSWILITGIFGIGLIATLNAIDSWVAARDYLLGLLLATTIFAIASLRAMIGRQFDKYLLYTLSFTALCYAAGVAVALTAAYMEEIPLLRSVLVAQYTNVRFFNQYQSWTLPLITLPLIIYRPSLNSVKALLYLAAILWWTLAFITFSRGSLLALLLAHISIALLFKKQIGKWLKLQTVTAVFGYLVYLLLIVLPQSLTKGQLIIGRASVGSSSRIELLQEALELVRFSPLIGIGPGNFSCGCNHHNGHPHNALMQISSEWGIVVVTLLIFLILIGITGWYRKVCRNSSTQQSATVSGYLIAGLSTSLLTAIIHAQLSGVIVMPMSQVMMVIVIGWMIAIYPSLKRTTFSDGTTGGNITNRRLTAFLLTTITAVLLLWGIVFKDLRNGIVPQSNSPICHIGMVPRFWLHGRICNDNYDSSKLIELPLNNNTTRVN